jgi:hypothetical protein
VDEGERRNGLVINKGVQTFSEDTSISLRRCHEQVTCFRCPVLGHTCVTEEGGGEQAVSHQALLLLLQLLYLQGPALSLTSKPCYEAARSIQAPLHEVSLEEKTEHSEACYLRSLWNSLSATHMVPIDKGCRPVCLLSQPCERL